MTAAGTESLDRLRREAASCRACPLWKDATQTVFGEGPSAAKVILVGEQPGDREDLSGRPFIGPAGQLLDRALADAGVDRARVYVTNAVKHFKFEPRGKRRLHKRPNAGEIKVCRRWLIGEIEAVTPQLIVALGATAAQSLAGRAVPIQSNRGAVIDLPSGLSVLITIHPSALLRLRDEMEKRPAYDAFVHDLRPSADRRNWGGHVGQSRKRAQRRAAGCGKRSIFLTAPNGRNVGVNGTGPENRIGLQRLVVEAALPSAGCRPHGRRKFERLLPMGRLARADRTQPIQRQTGLSGVAGRLSRFRDEYCDAPQGSPSVSEWTGRFV
jgi:uracil-DNA glycosylase family protein